MLLASQGENGLLYLDDLNLEGQFLARQRVVGVKRDFIRAHFSDGHVHLALLVGKLQGHARFQGNVRRGTWARATVKTSSGSASP